VTALAAAIVAASCSSGGTAEPPGTDPTESVPASTTVADTTSTTTAAATTSPTSAPAVVAAPSTGCASPTAPPRGVQQRVDLVGAARAGWYLRYVPTAVDLTAPAPLVLDVHGYLEGAQLHTMTSEMATVADRHGFVLVSPQGTGSLAFWNHRQRPAGPPDVAFLGSVIDAVEHDLCIDRTRVYVTGYSNGAFMASTLGCVMADRLAAIAPVAGARFDAGCAPDRPLPVLAFHGTADPIVAFDGGTSERGASLQFDAESAANFTGDVNRPVLDSVADWADVDDCAGRPTQRPSSPHVVLVQWNCPAGQEVALYEVIGGGHSWPGSAFSASVAEVVGPTTMEIDASELIWEFFAAHRRADPPAP
jgi:polyhydroxybutyrate depolymerase